ncbi:MAG: hypothetical protein HFI69_10765 [Lachnospiraceae bacterium]|nr:hypothetical protein [Lachnospiraceae bacterium]
MFGYIIINKPELKFREFDLYQSYYCGLCRTLKREYGRLGQMTLSYDMTFVILLLSSLYEPETVLSSGRCAAHPMKKRYRRINPCSEYGADMNLLLSYYKCLDDWEDEHKLNRKAMALSLNRRFQKAARKYPQKEQVIQEKMRQIHACEKQKSRELDLASGYFGEIMAEIFVWRKDEWEKELRRLGFFLGKFIYLMDAYEDAEQDQKTGNYNVFLEAYGGTDFFQKAENILSMMMAECARAFERLPIVENAEILRNILYSGVWRRYELVKRRREGK